MIYVIYKFYDEEPDVGYYWGKYEDPVTLDRALASLAEMGVYDTRVIPYSYTDDIPRTIEG